MHDASYRRCGRAADGALLIGSFQRTRESLQGVGGLLIALGTSSAQMPQQGVLLRLLQSAERQVLAGHEDLIRNELRAEDMRIAAAARGRPALCNLAANG